MSKNHEKSIQTSPKSFPNRSKTTPKSMNMRPWIIFGAESRPGRLQEGRGYSGDSVFLSVLAENVAPRVAFGIPGKPKIRPKPHF